MAEVTGSASSSARRANRSAGRDDSACRLVRQCVSIVLLTLRHLRLSL